MAKAYEELELNRCSEDTALTLNDVESNKYPYFFS